MITIKKNLDKMDHSDINQAKAEEDQALMSYSMIRLFSFIFCLYFFSFDSLVWWFKSTLGTHTGLLPTIIGNLSTHSQCFLYAVLFLNSQITHMWRRVCIFHLCCKFLQVRNACAFMTPKADAE